MWSLPRTHIEKWQVIASLSTAYAAALPLSRKKKLAHVQYNNKNLKPTNGKKARIVVPLVSP